MEIIEIFGEQYRSLKDAAKELRVKNYAKYLKQGLNNFDIEIVMSIDDLRGIKLQFVGLDRRARYAVIWSDEYQTTRQVIEYCRPDLLNIYDKTNPSGAWHPVKEAAVIGEQSFSIPKHQYANQIRTGRNYTAYKISNIGKMQRFKGRDKTTFIAMLRMTYDELGSLRTEYVYQLKEDIYFILGTKTSEKYLSDTDWYVVKDTAEEIKSLWPDVSKSEFERFVYGRMPNHSHMFGKFTLESPSVRKDFFIYTGGAIYRPKEYCGRGSWGTAKDGWLIMEKI